MPASSSVLQTTGLTRQFRRTIALDQLNLAIPEGAIYALVGVNGAGKTTLIKILMNILRPTRGRAEVFGRDSRCLSPADFRDIGYVSENQELPGAMTVASFLAYLKPFYPGWDDACAAALLRDFDLPPGRKLRHLSKGMGLKAALVSSLAYHPRLLVLDEPFTGLDPLVRDELIDGVLSQAKGTTVFISSHDLADVERFATHLGHLHKGRLRLSEEMTALMQRFRDVEIAAVCEALPSALPKTWMAAEFAAGRVRFVESQFENGRTLAEIRRVFGEQAKVAINPMPLREIFLTLAKAARMEA
ncbi:MAG TPA: ABC transporter ATP-binding protein [Bryobacteraceae bacterium]|nr:ABC transporter ATP-binding protein [Bryobacteraceae bacterium]